VKSHRPDPFSHSIHGTVCMRTLEVLEIYEDTLQYLESIGKSLLVKVETSDIILLKIRAIVFRKP